MTSGSAVAQRALRGQPFPRISPPIETSGCPTQRETSTPQSIDPDDFVELRRSSCFGSCPVYTVRVSADGRITWQGERYVRVTGEETGSIEAATARALIEKFLAMDGWSLCSSYSVRVTDEATVTTTFHVGDREKRISDYFNTAPDWLRELEYGIDTLANTHRWVHGDPRRETIAVVRIPGAVVKIGELIAPGIDADARGPKPGLTPLMQAAAKGDIDALQAELSAKVDVNGQDASGWTALMYATRAETVEAMRILIDAGANPNARSHIGQTAIMAVTNAYSAPLEKLRLLLEARADVNVQDSDGHTPLMFAMYGSLIWNGQDRQFLERVDSISLMRKEGARTDLQDSSGLSVFDYLDEEARRYAVKGDQAAKLRQILQN